MRDMPRSNYGLYEYWSWTALFFLIKGFLPHTFLGFPACNGVGSTLKRLTARASLQRPFSEEILPHNHLFEFANSEITSVTTFFVNSQSVKENIPFLEPRFSNCSTFKGTCKKHEFIPCGKNIVMNCVPEGAYENLLMK